MISDSVHHHISTFTLKECCFVWFKFENKLIKCLLFNPKHLSLKLSVVFRLFSFKEMFE